MAERSKAVDLSSIIVRCVGSNPTPGKIFDTVPEWLRGLIRNQMGISPAGVQIPPVSFCFVCFCYHIDVAKTILMLS